MKKLESNVIRDQLVKSDLERLGGWVITVWERKEIVNREF